MTEIVKYVPEGVRKKIHFKDDDELISETKKIYIEHIGGFKGGKKLIEYLEQMYGVDTSGNWVEGLSKKMDLVDIYYYFSYLFAATQNSNIFNFKRNGEINGNQCPELFNKYGQPIWDKPLSVTQKLWVCHKEDNNHVFLTFVSIGKEKRYFDPISQSFNTHTETGLINCRIHFDDDLIEVTPKNTGEDSITEALDFIKNKFGIISINPIGITDQDIRIFDKEVKQVTHEKREGEETTTALTRANKEGDTRKDTLHGELNAREFRKEHGLLEIDDGTHSIIGLTRGEMGRIQFKSYLEPSKRLILFHNLKDILKFGYEQYLFSWDEIQGNNNGKLIEFLNKKFGIDWVKTAKIEKIDNKAIKVSTEKNSLSLRLNDEKTKMSLKIDDGRTAEFTVMLENDKLNIYN